MDPLPSTLPQRMGLILLSKFPALVEGRVIDQDFRAVGKTSLPGVIPDTVVEVRDRYGKLNPLIVFDDQGPQRPVRGASNARHAMVACWVFYPEGPGATRRVLTLRKLIDGAMDGERDLLPPDHAHYPGEGTGGAIRFVDGIGTVSDGEAVYDRLLFRVAHMNQTG